MTTDTFPKVATAHGRIGGATVTHQRHRQGRRHDRARHGDDAVLRLHRRADRGAARCRRCCRAASTDTLQRDHRRRRHLDLRHAAAVRHRRRAARRADASPRRTTAARCLPERARRPCCVDLAQQVARDGEGARKFVEIVVEGAASKKLGARASRCRSPTRRWSRPPIAGEDANWGRVVMAVGKAGEPADRDRLAIWFGDMRVAVEGARDPAYDEAAVSAYMKRPEITIARRPRPRQRRGAGLDLRPHQGLCRDQRRLPVVRNGLVLAFVCGLAVGGPAAAQTIEAGRLKVSAAPRSSAPRITPPSRSAF